MPNKRTFFDSICVYLIMFPFVGFIPGIDVQPLALVVCCLYTIWLIINRINFKTTQILIALFLYCSCLMLSYFFVFNDLIFIIKEVFFLASFFLIILLVQNGYLKIKIIDIYIISFVYISVGLIQSVIPDFLSFLVSRGQEQIYMAIESGRGFRSLTGEPSHFGKVIILLNVFYVGLKTSENIKDKNVIKFSILMLASNMLITQSSYMVVIHFLLLVILFFSINKKLALLNILLLVVIVIYMIMNLDENSRLYMILHVLYHNPDELIQQGAFKRLINIPISLLNLSYFGFLGAGDSKDILVYKINTPIGEYQYLLHSKNMGGYVELILKYGVLSIPIIMYIFFILLRIYKSLVVYNFEIALFFTFSLFYILFQDGSVSNPMSIFIFYKLYFILKRKT